MASRPCFFSMGVTRARFNPDGAVPVDKETLTVLVTRGARSCRHCLVRVVGMGSTLQKPPQHCVTNSIYLSMTQSLVRVTEINCVHQHSACLYWLTLDAESLVCGIYLNKCACVSRSLFWQVLASLESSGPACLLKPFDLYHRCIQTGLMARSPDTLSASQTAEVLARLCWKTKVIAYVYVSSFWLLLHHAAFTGG